MMRRGRGLDILPLLELDFATMPMRLVGDDLENYESIRHAVGLTYTYVHYLARSRGSFQGWDIDHVASLCVAQSTTWRGSKATLKLTPWANKHMKPGLKVARLTQLAGKAPGHSVIECKNGEITKAMHTGDKYVKTEVA